MHFLDMGEAEYPVVERAQPPNLGLRSQLCPLVAELGQVAWLSCI